MVVLAIKLLPFGGSFLGWILAGLLAGAIAGRITRGSGFGCLGDIVIGLIGAFLGGWIMGQILQGQNVTTGFIGTTLVALGGALVLIFGLRLIRDLF
jgi:uncharacterized membrane protein YeaQ/YmgE (transglycosylase-associated protein family)